MIDTLLAIVLVLVGIVLIIPAVLTVTILVYGIGVCTLETYRAIFGG